MPSLASLRTVLRLDAAACAAMGLALALGAGPLAALTALPVPLLRGAGLLLLPVAAFIAVVAAPARIAPGGVRLVVAGNALWVAASLGVLALVAPNPLGAALVLGQAAAVAVLAGLEQAGLRGLPRPA